MALMVGLWGCGADGIGSEVEINMIDSCPNRLCSGALVAPESEWQRIRFFVFISCFAANSCYINAPSTPQPGTISPARPFHPACPLSFRIARHLFHRSSSPETRPSFVDLPRPADRASLPRILEPEPLLHGANFRSNLISQRTPISSLPQFLLPDQNVSLCCPVFAITCMLQASVVLRSKR